VNDPLDITLRQLIETKGDDTFILVCLGILLALVSLIVLRKSEVNLSLRRFAGACGLVLLASFVLISLSTYVLRFFSFFFGNAIPGLIAAWVFVFAGLTPLTIGTLGLIFTQKSPRIEK
jgi:hypothetical protein